MHHFIDERRCLPGVQIPSCLQVRRTGVKSASATSWLCNLRGRCSEMEYAADFIKLLKRIYSLIQVNYLNREWTDYVQMLFLGLLYSTFIIIFLALSLLQKLLQVTTLLRVPPMSLLLCAFTVRHGTCQQLRIMLSCTLKIKACISQNFLKGWNRKGLVDRALRHDSNFIFLGVGNRCLWPLLIK